MDDDEVIGCATLALAAMLAGRPERAAHLLAKIPRSQRGTVKIALDDLDMILNRLGKR